MSSLRLYSFSKKKKSQFFARLAKVNSIDLLDLALTLFLAKILGQVESAVKTVSVEILARPKGKDAPSDALPKFLAAYTAARKVGILQKETPSGKLVTEWQTLLDGAESKPETTDMTPAISTLMAVKDFDELVSL